MKERSRLQRLINEKSSGSTAEMRCAVRVLRFSRGRDEVAETTTARAHPRRTFARGAIARPSPSWRRPVHSTASITPSDACATTRRSRPRFENRLMVRAVNPGLLRSRHPRKPRARFDSHSMKRFGASSSSSQSCWTSECNSVGNVLNERAAKKNVQALNAVANREHWLMLAKAVLEQGEVGSLAVGVRLRRSEDASRRERAKDQRLLDSPTAPLRPRFPRASQFFGG